MSEKHSLANKKRWSKVPKKERSKKMSQLATIKAASMSKEAKRKHAIKMVRAKLSK